MDNRELNKEIALKWMDAFNEHDLAKLLALYTDDAIHFSPKLKLREPSTKGRISGKSSLHTWWEDAFRRLPALQYQLKNLMVDDRQVLMEYLRKVPGEDDIMVAEILEIDDEKICRSRVYHG